MFAKRYCRAAKNLHGKRGSAETVCSNDELFDGTVWKKRKMAAGDVPREVECMMNLAFPDDEANMPVHLVRDGDKFKMLPEDADPKDPDVIFLSQVQSLFNEDSEFIEESTPLVEAGVTTTEEKSEAVLAAESEKSGCVTQAKGYGIGCKRLFHDAKETTKLEVNGSYRAKWEPLEDTLYLLRDNIKAYIQGGTYNVAFSTIDAIIKETKSYVCNGIMSPRLGAARVLNHIGNLLFVHEMERENTKEAHRFDNMLLGYIETSLAKMKEVICTCDYYEDEYGKQSVEGNLRAMLDDVPDEFYEVPDQEAL